MRFIKHAVVIAAAVPAFAVGMAGPASAATHTTGITAAAKGPISEITGKSAAAALYKPNKLSAKLAKGTCSSTNYSFAIVNATKVSETVVSGGKTIVTLKPKNGEAFCFTSGSGSLKIGLKGDKKAVLTVTVA